MSEIKTIEEQELESEARLAEFTVTVVDTEEHVKRLAHSLNGVPTVDAYVEAKVRAAARAMAQAVTRLVALEED